ncbi:hypothetical protein DERP_005779 [Dermatophagoides pteronyssinus]|uniref:Uncharacterized protein n=1 Tax=Dermatophagoides pteronyssinus TaxID=6956 RepID=A0ABQ8J9I4_DERPT|nr:hypothetical protein DERP_005779 [Dermatophagoides pteronyssinus]
MKDEDNTDIHSIMVYIVPSNSGLHSAICSANLRRSVSDATFLMSIVGSLFFGSYALHIF